MIRQVGETEGVAVIDLQPTFERAGTGPLFQSDLHHPTAAGHALMASSAAEAVRPLLPP